MAALSYVLDAGSLRHQVQIQTVAANTTDSYGQPSSTWNTIRTAWASIALIAPKELYQSGQLSSQVTHLVLMRWSPTLVRAGMRVLFGSHTYKIQAVDNVEERNRVLKLFVLEIDGSE